MAAAEADFVAGDLCLVSGPPAPQAGAASSSAPSAVEQEHRENAPVFDDILNDDVAFLEDDTPIQAEADELRGTEKDWLAVMMTAHGGHHSC